MEDRKTLLKLNNVSKIYGNLHALSEINLEIKEGDWLSVMGPSLTFCSFLGIETS